MKTTRPGRWTVPASALVLCLAAGCGGAPPPGPASAAPATTTPAAAQTGAATPTTTPHATAPPFTEKVDFANQLEDIGAARFTHPTTVDNPWMPLKPGARYAYQGFTVEEGQRAE